MDKKQYDFLNGLTRMMSPSGFESDVSAVWRREAEEFADDAYTDQHGNSIAVLNPGGSPRIMMAGHIDEIGLMVTHIDAAGFVYFTGIGGWDMQVLPGQRVVIKTQKGRISGVIGRRPIHLLSPEERKKVVEFDGLWIDCGFRDKKEAMSVVSIGDPAVVQQCGIQKLKNGLMTGRGLDDKIGAFIVLEAARHYTSLCGGMFPEPAIYAVATVQEEIGTRGAKTAAYGINPDVAIAVDVGFATDTPCSQRDMLKVGYVKMGGGPIITCGPNIYPALFDSLRNTAQANKIPIQITADPGPTGTDAREFQVSRGGVPTALVSIPNRYMHSPVEIVHEGDVDNAIKLIAYTLRSI